MYIEITAGASALIVVFVLIIALMLRRVVPTNEVHIVQSSKKTTSYGNDTKNGNTYYEWPAWLPMIGITKIILPVSVFKLELESYDAYDTGRLPFEVDVVAFFRINDSNMAAQRVSSFGDLREQLLFIVRGAVRTILASHDIDKIMLERSTFGEAFTHEVQEQLLQWGVVPVKNIELMDIRDGQGNQVVHNIMQKKKSLIEMQSRTEVAANMKTAQIAEIDAKQEAEVRNQAAMEAVGKRSAEKDQTIGISQQQAVQAVREQERLTKEKEMAIVQVAQVRQAEIDKNVNTVKATQQKEVSIVEAEGNKQSNILLAEGNLEAKKRESEGIQIQGLAKAEAEKAMQLAPVQAQITLAKEIGSNDNYQKYLITIRQVEANQVVGIEQAKALEKANIKIIANTGDPVSGIADVRDLFTGKGGTSIGAMLEGLAQTEHGEKVIGAISAMGKK